MNSNSTFQIALLGVFGVVAVLAILIFSGLLPIFRSADEARGEVTVWGTVDEAAMNPLLEEVARANRTLTIKYVEKDPRSFDQEFIEALAAGRGPDLFLLPQDYIVRYEDKLLAIPYDNLSERAFKDTYIQEAELYLAKAGILGLPLTVDPLVLYWNRDILSTAGIANPPLHWEEVLSMTPALTTKGGGGTLTQSAIALGETLNVNHARHILELLFLQSGSRLVDRDEEGKPYVSLRDGGSGKGAEDSLRFFTQFSDPAKSVYTWSKALPPSKERFLAERLAFYVGYASEIRDIRAKNPHLNFDVIAVPTPGTAKTAITYGAMQALAIPRASKNVTGAYFLATVMSGKDFSGKLAEKLLLPSPRRDLLSGKPADAYLDVFQRSALNARGTLDINPETTEVIFARMVTDVTSGKRTPFDALAQAAAELEQQLR